MSLIEIADCIPRVAEYHADQVEVACDQYASELMGKIHDKITTESGECIIISFSQLDLLAPIGAFPRHILHYGKMAGNWAKRTPLPAEEMPFWKVQRILYQKGWYMYEITDFRRSNDIRLVVSAGEPCDKEYYNREGRLWHGHNVVRDYMIVD